MEELAKERAEAPEPEPVSHEGITYAAVPWGRARGLNQNGGYIAAINERTGDEEWLLKVYDVSYDPEMEDDKQDVFITRLSLEKQGKALRVENERGRVFLVSLKDRSVRPLLS